MRLIDDWKRNGRLPPRNRILHALTIILCYRDAFHPNDEEVPIHVDFIEMLGEIVGGKVAWARRQANARRSKARPMRYQILADEIWEKQPSLSKPASPSGSRIGLVAKPTPSAG
jgi:hypothetical protein